MAFEANRDFIIQWFAQAKSSGAFDGLASTSIENKPNADRASDVDDTDIEFVSSLSEPTTTPPSTLTLPRHITGGKDSQVNTVDVTITKSHTELGHGPESVTAQQQSFFDVSYPIDQFKLYEEATSQWLILVGRNR